MEITVHISDLILIKTVESAVAAAYLGQSYDLGQGKAAIKDQVVEWARKQDYTDWIEQLAPAIIREVVASELSKVIRNEVKRQVKTMQEAGELGGLFARADES